MAQNRHREIREYYEFHLDLVRERETIDLITEMLTTEISASEIRYMNTLRNELERELLYGDTSAENCCKKFPNQPWRHRKTRGQLIDDYCVCSRVCVYVSKTCVKKWNNCTHIEEKLVMFFRRISSIQR